MGHVTSEALFPSTTPHYSQLLKSAAAATNHTNNYGRQDQFNNTNSNGDQQAAAAKPHDTTTDWFNPDGVYGHHHRDPTAADDSNKVNDFLGASHTATQSSSAATDTTILPIMQNDHFQSILQPIYDQSPAVQQQQQQPPEAPAKPAADNNTKYLSLASLELLNNYGKGFKNSSSSSSSCAREENFMMNILQTAAVPAATDETGINNSAAATNNSTCRANKLALGEIMKVAAERYIQFSTQKSDGFSSSIHPYGIAPELSAAEAADVELMQVMLIAAECVGHRQFELASALVTRCLWIASDSGNAAQRIVFYFAEALQRRMDIETGRTTAERLSQQTSYARGLELDFNLSFVACHQSLPFIQVTQFAAMQAMADALKSAPRVHLVDLHIRSGVHWTVLMQSLAEREERPEIRISAVVATPANQPHVKETGKRLQSFAQSLGLALTFNSVTVEDIRELREDMFRREADEAVGVYASLILRTMLWRSDCLAQVMKVMRRLKPVVVVVNEVEANHNSPSFVSRFTESLFFYGTFFDCLEDCMERTNEHRKTIEGTYLGEGIRNMVGTEGDKRCTRNVTVEVWREYFGRFGMVEVELGDAPLRQANLILGKFHKADSCDITPNGKGLLIGWKGTPLHSLTTWKFV